MLASPASFAQEDIEAPFPVDFRQAANDDSPFALGDAHWINGILQQNNSRYLEGMSTPQRLIFLDIPATVDNVHVLTFQHQVQKSNIHAYDFMTSWAQAVAAADAIAVGEGLLADLFNDACGPNIGPPSPDMAIACAALRSSAFTVAVDVPDDMDSSGLVLGDSVNARIAAYESVTGNRTITIYGNQSISNATLVFDGYGGDDGMYTLTWTSSADRILIEMGGHLAVGEDNPGRAGIGYGSGRGAAGISGGPYHFKLTDLDINSLGSQDNQIKGTDILGAFCGGGVLDPGGKCDDLIPCTIDGCDEALNICTHTADNSVCEDNNDCTNNVCDTIAGCIFPPDNANACTDGNACTNDACVDGVCVSTDVNCSAFDSDCTVGVCNATTGMCEAQATNEGLGCTDDGNECTDDVCVAGACQHTPDDTNLCTDGDPCTNDACLAGMCIGTAVDCSFLDDQCNVGVCNAAGTCVAQPANENLPCDDGLFCSVGEVCIAGMCNNATSRDCGDGVGCTTDTCNETNDVCVHTPVNSVCDNGLFCDGQEFCDPLLDCQSVPDPCVAPLVCDEPNDRCVSCLTNAQCDDGEFCNGTETCDIPAGVCVAGTDPCPADAVACTIDSCDEAANVCLHTPDDAACPSDGNLCTLNVCDALLGCVAPPVPDGNACGIGTDTDCDNPDSCLGGVCVTNEEPAGTMCPGDGNECTFDECDGAGNCTHPPVADNTACLSDGNDCTDDVCLMGVCQHLSNDLNTCTDGLLCTNDACVSGTCVGTQIDCSMFDGDCTVGVCNAATGMCEAQPANEGGACTEDGNACTDDVCMAGVCEHLNDDTNTCDDGVNCTTDACVAGTCVPTPIDCSSLDDDCLEGVCNEATGTCQASPSNETGPCTGDGNDCTDDVCMAGVCEHPNDDTNACTDLNNCTNDACVAGACVGTAIDCSSLDDQCNTGVCNAATGTCQAQPANQGQPCTDDGLFCNGPETCGNGACTSGGDPCGAGLMCDEVGDTCVECFVDSDCTDTNGCTVDACSSGGVCTHTNVCGACCVISDGTCIDGVTPGECAANLGSFLGAGKSCAGDADGDGRDDACPAPAGIPTMSQWGFAVMTLLLLIVAKVYFGRRFAPIRVERRS